jgi:hypothetical protein
MKCPDCGMIAASSYDRRILLQAKNVICPECYANNRAKHKR